MNSVIRQCVDNIEAIRCQMKEKINKVTTCVTIVPEHLAVEKTSIKKTIYSLLIILSLLTILISIIIGCFSDSFLWLIPFLLGVLFLCVGVVMTRRSNRIQYIYDNPIKSSNLSGFKQTKTQNILSVIGEINILWENQSATNKEHLFLYLGNLDLSSNEKFNASSLIAVTKTIDFELLKIHNQIDAAESIAELNECLMNIKTFLNDKLDNVCNLQIDAYLQIEKILSK